jgi:two-component system CitB family sensor kinase
VAVQAGPEGVGVRVRDSGPGVGSALGDEIFEEGFTTKAGTSHQGLGLALARQVAQRRGGWLRVSNEGGAVFTALLPSDAAVTR